MDLAAATFLALAVLSLASCLSSRAARRSSALAAAGLEGARHAAPLARPPARTFLRPWVTRLGQALSPPPGEELRELLADSGVAWTHHYLQGLRLGAGLLLSIAALPLGLVGLAIAPALFAAGYHMPVLALKRRRQKRWEEVGSDLPEIVDLMAVLCFSGESLSQAFRHSVVACGHPSSRREIEAVLERLQLGESAAEALRRAANHPCRELRRLSRTLLRAEEFGAPIADTLEELASELRCGRRERERVRASRVSVLILFPLVFLILPSFLLLTIGGMILGYAL